MSIYKFDEGSYTVRENSIYGSGKIKLKHSNKRFEDYTGSVYLEDIESFKFDKFNAVITVLVIALSVGFLFLTGQNFGKRSGDSGRLSGTMFSEEFMIKRKDLYDLL